MIILRLILLRIKLRSFRNFNSLPQGGIHQVKPGPVHGSSL